MRILHFFKTYLPDTTGGIEQAIFQLCQGGRQLGITSEVLTLSPAPEPTWIQVADHRVRRAKQDLFLASTGLSLEVFKLFKEMSAEADIIHFHFPWPMMDLVHLCTHHNRPTILSYHSDIVRQRTLLSLYRPLMKKFLNSMDRIIVASPNYQKTSKILKKYTEKTVIIPYGLNPEAYPKTTEERKIYWKKTIGERFFLFIGVLRYYKGLSTLLDASIGLSYPIVIIGSGPQEAELKAKAEKLKLTNIKFLGKLDELDKKCLLELCHAMIFPSHLRSEAFGISLLEASMHGKPMISCEIGTGTTFVNLNEVTGLTVPPEEPQALRKAMRRLWDSEDEARQFGSNAAHRFTEIFTAEKMCQDTALVYQQVLDEHRKKENKKAH